MMYNVFLIVLSVAVGVWVGFVNLLLAVLLIAAFLGVGSILLWKGKVIIPLVVIIITILFIIHVCIQCF